MYIMNMLHSLKTFSQRRGLRVSGQERICRQNVNTTTSDHEELFIKTRIKFKFTYTSFNSYRIRF